MKSVVTLSPIPHLRRLLWGPHDTTWINDVLTQRHRTFPLRTNRFTGPRDTHTHTEEQGFLQLKINDIMTVFLLTLSNLCYKTPQPLEMEEAELLFVMKPHFIGENRLPSVHSQLWR